MADTKRNRCTAWVTKYALSDGIQQAEVEINDSGRAYPVDQQTGKVDYFMSYGKNNWHTSREAAVEQANRLKEKKIASLEKQLAQVRALEF